MKTNHELFGASSIRDAEFWENLPVHPEADKLPMMSPAEIKDMSRDIFGNGLRELLDLFVDNTEEQNGAKGPFRVSLMDGRGRLAALRLLGHKTPFEQNADGVRYHNAIKFDRKRKKWVTDCDPVKYILSKNVYRRHLTVEQKRQAIAAYIKADPTASNREVGRALKVDKNTVESVRKEGESNGEIHQMTHPEERAEAELQENPSLSSRELAEKANVSQSTAARAKRKQAEPKPKAPLKADKKPSQELIDEIATEVASALDRIWQAHPEVDWPMLVAIVRSILARLTKTGKLLAKNILGTR